MTRDYRDDAGPWERQVSIRYSCNIENFGHLNAVSRGRELEELAPGCFTEDATIA